MDVRRPLATVHDRLGETNAAADLADGVLRPYQQSGLRRGEAHALKAIGSFRAKLGMPADGLATCARSLRIFRQLGDVDGHSDGLIHQRLGRHRRARRLREPALELYAQVGDDYGRADALLQLGDALHAGGKVAWR